MLVVRIQVLIIFLGVLNVVKMFGEATYGSSRLLMYHFELIYNFVNIMI